MNSTDNTKSLLPDFNSPAAIRFRRWRGTKDAITRYLMALGGISVIAAIVLIAFYLLYVVLPMFKPASLSEEALYKLPGSSAEQSLFYAMEEQHEVALRLTDQGNISFFATDSGALIEQHNVLSESQILSSYSHGDPAQTLLALGLENGQVKLLQHAYKVTYPDDVRLITPILNYPFGEEALALAPSGQAIELISAQYDGSEEATVAAISGQTLYLLNILREESMLSDEVEVTEVRTELDLTSDITHLVIDVGQREMYLASADGFISFYDISRKQEPRLIQKIKAVKQGKQITSLAFLSGGISILVGYSDGHISQWFPVRGDDNQYTLELVRSFAEQDSAIIHIEPEYFRKGFVAIDENGGYSIYHTTAHRVVKSGTLSDGRPAYLAIAPRANAMLVEDSQKQIRFLHIHNEHPEISWKSIWGKVWYESREKPEYIWQSSSASSDFEPKFSLTPLAFGTLKAAFYAMLFAIPMAICGAIYTAYFMSSKMRAVVKPTIEIMEALPTVILGFLAGLWFAPFVEKNMPGMFLMLVTLPISVLVAAYLWQQLPRNIRIRVPDGWEAAILIPVIATAIGISVLLSQPMEQAFFGGNMPFWISSTLGLDYDQRNSLVVGIAMGFAVIPTIFSISEDAIYSVPRHLTTGSLALGATRWQTMIRVVLLTASPGIFSAIMIGMGRAVGETMIVVMATGNTAIMDMNIFQGFRALSANIAVEMPESEVGSTHYRILFLAGLVLFMATFVFNTAAEVVRHRLRTKYSSL